MVELISDFGPRGDLASTGISRVNSMNQIFGMVGYPGPRKKSIDMETVFSPSLILSQVNRLGITVPYWSFGDAIPVPTVARVHFLSSKLWYKILPASIAMLFC